MIPMMHRDPCVMGKFMRLLSLVSHGNLPRGPGQGDADVSLQMRTMCQRSMGRDGDIDG